MWEILTMTSGWVNRRTKDIQSYPWVSAVHGLCPSQALYVACSHLVAKHQPLAVRQHIDILTQHNNKRGPKMKIKVTLSFSFCCLLSSSSSACVEHNVIATSSHLSFQWAATFLNSSFSRSNSALIHWCSSSFCLYSASKIWTFFSRSWHFICRVWFSCSKLPCGSLDIWNE